MRCFRRTLGTLLFTTETRQQTCSMERFVVVTGTSRGIGRATALRLARHGYQVFGTVRSEDDATSLEGESGGSVRALRLDLTDDEAIREGVDRLSRSGVDVLHGLINVAAAGGRAVPLEAATREDLDRQFAVTVAGTAILTGAMVPLLSRGRGRVVNVGSGAISMPLLGTTFAAKQALEALSDVLRIELAAVGIPVIVVVPGMTRWHDIEAQRMAYDQAIDEGIAAVRDSERARYSRTAAAFKQLNRRMLDRGAAAEDVAATIERALTTRLPRARYYCGIEQKFAAALSRVMPAFITDRVVRRTARI
jgi:NAD(P)-dependent dehydrogenase (short-subunit alcohol dehydrogenase family)